MKKILIAGILVSLSALILASVPFDTEKIASDLPRLMNDFFIRCDTFLEQTFPGIHLTRDVMIAVFCLALFILLSVFAFMRLNRRRRPGDKKDIACEKIMEEHENELPPPPPAAPAAPTSSISENGDVNSDMVVRFFLNIYKIQLGALKGAPAEYEQVKTINAWPNRVYDLKVLHEGKLISRRLTVGPLGDGGVSKSICYYVIFDDHLVVKIPAEPITDFHEYLACIKADRAIVRRLHPKECVIPRVSVVLGRLVAHGSKDIDQNSREKQYIDQLINNKRYQEYLKIGGSFVFFMDLARHYFLSSVLNEIHNMENAMPQEILGNPHIIWDSYEFEGRYGRGNAHIGFEMRNIYDEYEREIKRLQIKYGDSKRIDAFTTKNWFLVHLAGRGRIERTDKFSEGFIEDLNALSLESMIDNRLSIESYRKVIREYIYTSTIARYKAEMGSIVTNLIGLLVWLGRKQVSMRDLKPDNLLIAGDPEKYPGFLKSPDQFTMGFIDVETAVDYAGETDEEILQPQLGGTPKYATPTHLFSNELIRKIYGDLKRIFHLQDWYAAVAMIFQVVTGGTLFEKTAMALPEIKRIMESPIEDEGQLLSITEYVSRMFWKSSFDEFYEKMDKNRKILNTIDVIILDKDKKNILVQMVREKKTLAQKMLKRINDQHLFTSKRNREFLYRAPADKITAMREKCERDVNLNLSNTSEIVCFLNGFERLKIQYEQRCRNIEFLKSSRNEIPVATMMEVMFNIVVTAMYTEVWGEFSDEIDTAIGADADGSYDATL